MELPLSSEVLGRYGKVQLPQDIWDEQLEELLTNQLVNQITQLTNYAALRHTPDLPRLIGNLVKNCSAKLDWMPVCIRVMKALFPDMTAEEERALEKTMMFLERHKHVRLQFLRKLYVKLFGKKKQSRPERL